MSWYPPPSIPRRAKGGIRAQSQRGAFGASWWARRWIEVLNGFNIGARLGRGRSYARKGQVLSIDIGESEIHATVQGSRPKPYEVSIRVKPVSKAAWSKVAAAVSSQAIFASKLLAGEMPQEIEQVFRDAGASLFPERYRDLTTDCSCPDWSNPCKHVAAVYYLLGEEFDRDPFLIFRMRGIPREAFLGEVGEGSVPKAELPPEPLPAAPSRFWSAPPPELPPLEPVLVTEAALPRRLGKFPLWRGSMDLHEFLDRVYTRAALHASQLQSGANERP